VSLQKRLYSAKKTYSFKKPTNRSHPIAKYARIWCSSIVRYVVCVAVFAGEVCEIRLEGSCVRLD